MIAYLKGKIKSRQEDYIILDCNGVGYKIEVGTKRFMRREAEKTEFYIYTHVRENELKLFGFESLEELEVFELLLDVSGVGPKVALSLIVNLGAKKVVSSILQKDASGLKVTGVGIRTADKIVLELNDKLKKKGYSITDEDKSSKVRNREFLKKLDEAKDALRSLGYSASDVVRVIESAKFDKRVSKMTVEELVKYLLSKI